MAHKLPAGRARANGIELAYETFGAPSDPAVLLVMGLGTQMIAWPDELCDTVARRGHHVIRFDNRDVGLSTHLALLPAPSPFESLVRRTAPPYRIEDMARDAAGLLDALGIDSAHVVGASMGGFIAQRLVLDHPARVRSLSLVMTSTGSWRVGRPNPGVLLRLGRRRPIADRWAAADAVVDTFRLIGSSGYPFDEARLRDVAERSYDRAFDPDGYLRQLAAVMAQRDRSGELGRVRLPAVVLHGLDDPLVSPSGGRALARAIPDARFVGFSGMGHDLPRELWPLFADEICAVAARGERRGTSRSS